MNPSRRLLAAVAFLGSILVIGTLGYMLIEGAVFSDALYMTVITISTVGYSEVFPLSGAGRIYTSALIVGGVGAALYTAAIGLEIVIERLLGGERRRRKMARVISALDDHVIVCGFGRVGRTVWQALERAGTPSVIVEIDAVLVDLAENEGALVLEGDATTDAALEQAGIDRARALIACVMSDADNLVIVLSAKNRCSDLRVIARASEVASESKLTLAGADRVVAPQRVGAERLAALAAQPRIDEFVDLVLHGKLVSLRIEEFTVRPGAELAGETLRGAEVRRKTGALVLAVEDARGIVQFNPDPDLSLLPGHTIIGMGTESQLMSLAEIVSEA